MSTIDNTEGLTFCTNVEGCSLAIAGEKLPWYRGPGEYCPECGEALTAPESARVLAPPPNPILTASAAPVRVELNEIKPIEVEQIKDPTAEAAALPADAPPAARPNPESETPERPPGSPIPTGLPPVVDEGLPPVVDEGLPPAQRDRRPPPSTFRRRLLWIVPALLIAALGAAWGFGGRIRIGSDIQVVCAPESSRDFAAALVHAYAAESRTPENHFAIADTGSCDVRFTTAGAAPDAVIAHDAVVVIVNAANSVRHLTEDQVRGIFGGSLRDWSQVGTGRGAIVPLLPAADSDVAKIISLSMLWGVGLDRGVRRGGTSADVTRGVADRSARDAIALVAFSQAGAARVVPLALFPEPSAQSIAAGRYPYSWTIAVESESTRGAAVATGLLDYARSPAGANVIQKYGLSNNN